MINGSAEMRLRRLGRTSRRFRAVEVDTEDHVVDKADPAHVGGAAYDHRLGGAAQLVERESMGRADVLRPAAGLGRKRGRDQLAQRPGVPLSRFIGVGCGLQRPCTRSSAASD